MEEFTNKREGSDSGWIEEEEKLIHWAENPNFEKTPLDHIALTFVYTNGDKTVVGISKTIMELETQNTFSILHQTSFFDKINVAKKPFTFETYNDGNPEWLKKSYTFDESILCHIAIDTDSNNLFDPKVLVTPLQFSNDIAKISSSRVELKDLYEIVVIMREATPVPPPELKSILKTDSKPGKTKKVRIDENVHFVAKSNKKRKTKKRHTSSPFIFS